MIDAIKFIDCPGFHEPNAEERFLKPLPVRAPVTIANQSPLERITAEEPLTDEQQRTCFFRMNYCKFRANQATTEERARWMAMAHEAKATLMLCNQRLVLWVVRGLKLYPNEDRLDVAAVGNIALARSVDMFDPAIDVKFSTYAVTAMKRRCWQALSDERLKWSNRAVQFGDDEDQPWRHIDQVADGRSESNVGEISDRDQVARLLRRLPTRQREIVAANFGLSGPCQSLGEIAARLSLSKERIRQIIEMALSKMRSTIDAPNGVRSAPATMAAAPLRGLVPDWLAMLWVERDEHEYKALGANYRGRERFNRLCIRWERMYKSRDVIDQRAILSGLLRVEDERHEGGCIMSHSERQAAFRSVPRWLVEAWNTVEYHELGDDFRSRERVARLARRWQVRFQERPQNVRTAILKRLLKSEEPVRLSQVPDAQNTRLGRSYASEPT